MGARRLEDLGCPPALDGGIVGHAHNDNYHKSLEEMGIFQFSRLLKKPHNLIARLI